MNFTQAITYSRSIMENNPHYVLCGSVGMILRGAIPNRTVKDLDFACYEKTSVGTFDNTYPPMQNDGYLCYKITSDKGFYYNLFVFDKPDSILFDEVDGLKVQNAEQMLHYKKIYSRPKDISDFVKSDDQYDVVF